MRQRTTFLLSLPSSKKNISSKQSSAPNGAFVCSWWRGKKMKKQHREKSRTTRRRRGKRKWRTLVKEKILRVMSFYLLSEDQVLCAKRTWNLHLRWLCCVVLIRFSNERKEPCGYVEGIRWESEEIHGSKGKSWVCQFFFFLFTSFV